MLLGYMQKLLNLWLIETNDNVVADNDNRHAHLPAFLYHFRALGLVLAHIEILKDDFVLCKEILGHMTEMA